LYYYYNLLYSYVSQYNPFIYILTILFLLGLSLSIIVYIFDIKIHHTYYDNKVNNYLKKWLVVVWSTTSNRLLQIKYTY
jgi:hypothetical protein